jgi:hypothetical protein
MAELHCCTVPRLHTYSLQTRPFISVNSCFATFNIDAHLQGSFTYRSFQSLYIRHHTIQYLLIIQKVINLKHTDSYYYTSLTMHHELIIY